MPESREENLKGFKKLADIFVSYASEDRARIQQLVTEIEGAGFSVWWDREIRGGSRFSAEIEKELKQARVVLVAWSPAAITSRWVADEADLGLQLGKLVPLSFDNVPAPIGFRQIQTIDFSRWQEDTQTSCLDELLKALQSFVSPQAETEIKNAAESASIAVLPFVNMSSDPEQAYFSEGIAEELLNLLAKLGDLHVAARTSSFALRDTKKSTQEIGSLLGVAHILEGSVRKAGNRVRITAQLIKASSGFHLWSETYDRTLDDIFAVQDEIAAAIVEALKGHILSAKELATTQSERSDNVEAYDHYLKGHFLIQGTNLEVINRGLDELRAAIRLDPGFALPYADISDALSQLYSYGNYQNDAVLAEARDAAFTAVRLAPDLAEAHSAIASVHEFITLDWRATDAAYEKAISLSSLSPVPFHRYAEFLWMTLRLDKAREMARRAIEVDPLDGNAMHAVGITALMSGHFRTAAEAFGKWNSLYPDSIWAYVKHGVALAQSGQSDAAREQLGRAKDLRPDYPTPLLDSWISWGFQLCGDEDFFSIAKKAIQSNTTSTKSQLESALFWIHMLDADDEALLALMKEMIRTRHPHGCLVRYPLLDYLKFPVTPRLKAREDYWDFLKTLDLPPSSLAADPRENTA